MYSNNLLWHRLKGIVFKQTDFASFKKPEGEARHEGNTSFNLHLSHNHNIFLSFIFWSLQRFVSFAWDSSDGISAVQPLPPTVSPHSGVFSDQPPGGRREGGREGGENLPESAAAALAANCWVVRRSESRSSFPLYLWLWRRRDTRVRSLCPRAPGRGRRSPVNTGGGEFRAEEI